jgi:hypothetical protein
VLGSTCTNKPSILSLKIDFATLVFGGHILARELIYIMVFLGMLHRISWDDVLTWESELCIMMWDSGS